MSTDRKLERTHNALSPWDWKFRLYARASDDCLRRATFRLLDENQPLLTYRRQPWPTYVGPAKVGELARVSLGISRLLRTIPERIFEGDAERITEFYGLEDPAFTRLLLEEPTGFDGAVGRGDFIDTADGFRCLEFNIGANLGGWETGILADLYRQIPVVAEFVRQNRLSPTFTDTTRRLYEHVLDEAEDRGVSDGGEVNVAFTSNPVSAQKKARGAVFKDYLDGEYRRLCELRGCAGRVIVCTDQELSGRRDGLYCRGTRVHAVVETDTINTMPEVFRAFKAGTALLYNGPASYVLTSKRNIALLSEHRDDPRFSAEERQLIRDHVPWTTRLLAHYVDYRGERMYLPELLAAERPRFVLKDSLSVGGKGVRLGQFTTDEEWETLIDEALAAGDWLVQEKVESLPYLYQCGDYGCAPHTVIWGPFVFGDRYAGNVLRMQPRADPGAVNLSLTATQGMIFELPDTPA